MEHEEDSMAGAVSRSAHTFHIPVMGTGYTVDTPLHVAKYGISSVISLVDDVLIEKMREFHCARAGEPYEEIRDGDEDPRARRITAYLDLMDRLIRPQIEALQRSDFQPGSEITRYFEMLPETPLKQAYRDMLAAEPQAKARMQQDLRARAVPGDIDVNIMTKLDRDLWQKGRKMPPEFADAMSALRGFAQSTLASSMIFSAGLNPRLYTYAAQFDDFFPGDRGAPKKRIVLKVSDFRSAAVQGRFLAKRGLWVSEYRVESGLNCGGHAFATKGLLMGPILEEFKREKDALIQTLHEAYVKALAARGRPRPDRLPEAHITVQGGITDADENRLMLEYYEVDRTGWATPFLLVPEVVNIDEEHLAKLQRATERDVYLSDASPLNVPYWNLRTSASEANRHRLIAEGRPGSVCKKRFARLNDEFPGTPICTASRAYQKRKLERLPSESCSPEDLLARTQRVLGKSCICHDLAGGATVKHGIDPGATPAICPGPNIAEFSQIATLPEMIGHIYGRLSLLTHADPPHMFIREIRIYVEHLRDEMHKFSLGLSAATPKYLREFGENILSGIEYYRHRIPQLLKVKRDRFLLDLEDLRDAMERLMAPEGTPAGLDGAT